MEQISRIGMDTSKHFFQVHGVNASEKVVLRKKLRRKEMVAFCKALASTVIGIEACGASRHCARILRLFGHEVKLIAAQLAKSYVKRGTKNAADAALLTMKTLAPQLFKSGRQVAAWIGSPPKDHAPAGKVIRALDATVHGGNRQTFDELVVHRRLEEFVSRHGTANAAASALGISKSYVHEIRAGHRPVSDSVLAVLGIEQVKTARKYRSL